MPVYFTSKGLLCIADQEPRSCPEVRRSVISLEAIFPQQRAKYISSFSVINSSEAISLQEQSRRWVQLLAK